MSRSLLDILQRWASAFNVELAMSDSPAEAQAHAAVASPRPPRPSDSDSPNVAPVSSTTDPSSSGFSHRALAQRQRKKITFKFEPADGSGTHVRIDAPWLALSSRWSPILGTGRTRSTAHRCDPYTLALATNL
jgi:hypothetical protein